MYRCRLRPDRKGTEVSWVKCRSDFEVRTFYGSLRCATTMLLFIMQTQSRPLDSVLHSDATNGTPTRYKGNPACSFMWKEVVWYITTDGTFTLPLLCCMFLFLPISILYWFHWWIIAKDTTMARGMTFRMYVVERREIDSRYIWREVAS